MLLMIHVVSLRQRRKLMCICEFPLLGERRFFIASLDKFGLPNAGDKPIKQTNEQTALIEIKKFSPLEFFPGRIPMPLQPSMQLSDERGMMTRVLLACDGFDANLLRQIQQALDGWAKLIRISQDAPQNIFREHLLHSDVVVGWPDAQWLSETPVRVLQVGSSGFDAWLDYGLEKRPNFTFCSARGVYSVGIAEHCLAMMLAFCRQIPRHMQEKQQRMFRNTLWESNTNIYGEIHGATACIVGLGHVGTQVARLCAGMGMRVIAVNLTNLSKSEFVEQIYPADRLLEAVAQADHVLLTCPGGAGTRHLIDRKVLTAMKKGSYLYNVARGSVVNESDLIEFLQNGHLAGAGLDVFATEPLPRENPLWNLENVIITPHVAGFAARYEERLCDLVVSNLLNIRDGKPLINVVPQLSSTQICPAARKNQQESNHANQ